MHDSRIKLPIAMKSLIFCIEQDGILVFNGLPQFPQ